MAKVKYKRGQVVQDDAGGLFLFVKRSGKTAHLVELDEYGNPSAITTRNVAVLGKPKHIPETFIAFDITL